MARLVRWEPFRDLVSLQDAMHRLFEESFVQSRVGWPASVGMQSLAVDMYETDEAIVVKTAVPGIKPEALNVSIVGDTLTIRGETKAEGEIKKENYIRRERRCGSFCRSLVVPLPVMADEAEAEFENGILTLTLPKAEEVKPKVIEVKAKSK